MIAELVLCSLGGWFARKMLEDHRRERPALAAPGAPRPAPTPTALPPTPTPAWPTTEVAVVVARPTRERRWVATPPAPPAPAPPLEAAPAAPSPSVAERRRLVVDALRDLGWSTHRAASGADAALAALAPRSPNGVPELEDLLRQALRSLAPAASPVPGARGGRRVGDGHVRR